MRIADGRYTGEMEFYAYGEAKAAQVRELAEQRGYSLARSYAYSDSVTDLPLLQTVGHPYAVNPDRSLRQIARQRGWPVLEFSPGAQTAGDQATSPGQGHESPMGGQTCG